MKSCIAILALAASAIGQSNNAVALAPRAFIPLGMQNELPLSLASDATGNFYVAGTEQNHVLALKVDSNGKVLYSRSFGGSGIDRPLAIAVDTAGSSYVVGVTSSLDFPVVNSNPSTGTLFCTKLSPDGSAIVYSTLIGTAYPSGAAADSSGSLYLTGVASSKDLAATPGAFQTASHGPDAFVLKLGPDGKIAFATFLGGNGPACNPGGSCLVGVPFPAPLTDDEEGFGIAVDQTGNVYVAGVTNAADFPVTPNAFQTKYADPAGMADQGFIAKLSPDGSQLLYSTYLGTASGERIVSLAVDSSGEAVVGGHTYSTSFPTTADALFPSPHAPGGFIGRLNSQGSALVYATYLGNSAPGNNASEVGGIAIDDGGNIDVTGWAGYGTIPTSDFPVTTGAMPTGFTYFTQLSGDGKSLIYSTLLPYGSGGTAVATGLSRTSAVLGDAGVLTIFGQADLTLPTVFGLANIAGPYLDGQVAPGEIISLYGTNLGPDQAVALKLDSSGFITTDLAGVQVTFDGILAPVIMAQRNQLNVQVPYEIAGKNVTAMQITSAVGTSQSFPLQVAVSEPGILTVDTLYAAAINQDGSINTQYNPAPQGSIITLFATGTGLWNGDLKTGQVSSASLVSPKSPVKVLISSNLVEAEVLYAGSAPTLTDGVLQLNIRLPISSAFNLITQFILQVGDAQSPVAAVYSRVPGTNESKRRERRWRSGCS
jgi:uncharacterized protein (TIGR03437 family)